MVLVLVSFFLAVHLKGLVGKKQSVCSSPSALQRLARTTRLRRIIPSTTSDQAGGVNVSSWTLVYLSFHLPKKLVYFPLDDSKGKLSLLEIE